MQSAARAVRLLSRRRFAIEEYAPGQQTQVFLRVLGRNEYHIMSAVLARGGHEGLRENAYKWDASRWLCLGECGVLLVARSAHEGYAAAPCHAWDIRATLAACAV